MLIYGYTKSSYEVLLMEVDFLPSVEQFFKFKKANDVTIAELIVLLNEIAGTTPPTAYPGVCRLQGEALRKVNYVRYYRRGESIRMYFMVRSHKLLVILIIPNKRRDALTDGDMKQIKNAMNEGMGRFASEEENDTPRSRVKKSSKKR